MDLTPEEQRNEALNQATRIGHQLGHLEGHAQNRGEQWTWSFGNGLSNYEAGALDVITSLFPDVDKAELALAVQQGRDAARTLTTRKRK